MTRILYIKASPRGERSHCTAVADAFVTSVAQEQDAEIVVKNLFEAQLPHLDGPTLNGKYNIIHGRPFSETDKQKWELVEKTIEEFKSFDKYVFAIPMWNFSIPYRLKHYMDIIAQPTYTFTAGPDGYKGLVNSKAFIAYARGGDYPDDSPFNFQANYVKHYLGFIGITDVTSVVAQPTLAGGPEARDAAKLRAIEEAIELAKSF